MSRLTCKGSVRHPSDASAGNSSANQRRSSLTLDRNLYSGAGDPSLHGYTTPPFTLKDPDNLSKDDVIDPDDPFGLLTSVRPLTTADGYRLVFFERLFFLVDSDSNGYVTLQEMDRLLSFLALESSDNARLRLLKVLDDEHDGMIQQDEFISACMLLLWNVPQEQLQWAADNFIQAVTTKTDRNSHYWRKCAKRVDELSRLWICSAYAIYLGWVYSLRMYDIYRQPDFPDTTKLHHTTPVKNLWYPPCAPEGTSRSTVSTNELRTINQKKCRRLRQRI